MYRCHYLWVAFSVFCVLVVGSCAGQATPAPADVPAGEDAPLPDIGPIRVGHIPTTGAIHYWLAIEKGYFEEQGLEVELQPFRSGSLMIAPLSAGELDVGHGEAMGVPLLNAIHQGLDVKVVSNASYQTEGACGVSIVVRKDLYDSGEITSPADLQGRKVALNKERVVGEYLLDEMMGMAGLTIDDIELVIVPFPEIPAALANQAVDAAYLPGSLAVKAIADGTAVVLLDAWEIVDPYQQGLQYFGQRFLDPANREAAIRFTVAYLKAVRDMARDGWSDEHAAIANKYTETPIAVIQSSPTGQFNVNGTIDIDAAMKVQDYHLRRGHTDFDELLPMDQIIDESFLEEALARIGRMEE